jgi:hypothetical protein
MPRSLKATVSAFRQLLCPKREDGGELDLVDLAYFSLASSTQQISLSDSIRLPLQQLNLL